MAAAPWGDQRRARMEQDRLDHDTRWLDADGGGVGRADLDVGDWGASFCSTADFGSAGARVPLGRAGGEGDGGSEPTASL
jgi:hypothetical protein